MTSDPDERARDAVQAVKRGDRDAFAHIIAAYERRLFGLALMMTRDAAGAEEVAQDAFVRAYVHLDAYDARRPFYPWLATIAVRLAQNWRVKRARIGSREGAPLDATAVPRTIGNDALEGLIADEGDRALWRSVSALPAGERTAVILYYRQDMSVGEIASVLGITAGTVKTQLFRARQRLRATLSETYLA